MKKILALALLSLGFTAPTKTVDLATALSQVESAQTAANAIPGNIATIRTAQPLEKLLAVSELLSNLSSLSGPLAEVIITLNKNKFASKIIPRQLVTGLAKLNEGIQAAANAL